jgi:hypothetical protein
MIRALLFLAIVLPAAAQQTAPVEPKKEPARPPLNLQLDNPSSFATVRPPEKNAEKGLPALGDDARKFAPPKREGTGPTQTETFPKDTNPNR